MSQYGFGPCSCGSWMLKPTECRPPPCSRGSRPPSRRARRRSRRRNPPARTAPAVSRAKRYGRDSSPTRADPKIDTAGRPISSTFSNPFRNSAAMKPTSDGISPSCRRSSRRSIWPLVTADPGERARRSSRARERPRAQSSRRRRCPTSRRASAGLARPPPGAEHAPGAQDVATVEEADRDQVEEVEEEARVGERTQERRVDGVAVDEAGERAEPARERARRPRRARSATGRTAGRAARRRRRGTG